MHPIAQNLKSALGRVAREALLYPQIFGPGKGPGKNPGRRVMFFPSSGREQSGLLRVYNIAEHLNPSGWRCVVVPKHLRLAQRNRLLRSFQPDLVVLQTCRHPLNRMAHFPGERVILDIDDADFFDPARTKVMEETAAGAAGVICGSRFIRDWARQFNPNADVIWTGTPISSGPWPSHGSRAKIVTWAQSNPLAYPEEFAFITRLLVSARPDVGPFTLRLYGWYAPQDHPSLAPLREAGITLELIGTLPYADFVLSLREVAVGLSPIMSQSDFSLGKSFGKVLGYLDAKVPVICSDKADHSEFFTAETGVVSDAPSVWKAALQRLLTDAAQRQAMSDAAHTAFCQRLSTQVAAQRVGAFLEQSMGTARGGPPAAP